MMKIRIIEQESKIEESYVQNKEQEEKIAKVELLNKAQDDRIEVLEGKVLRK